MDKKIIEMEQLAKKSIRKYLITCIIISALIFVGIPFIPIGIVVFNKMYIWIPAIVFSVVGFYGAPIMWTFFPSFKRKWTILLAIYRDNILDIGELAATFRMGKWRVKSIVGKLLSDGKLTGYKMNKLGTALEPAVRKVETKEDKEQKRVKCEFCRAPLKKGEEVCCHCGTMIR